MNLPLTLRPIEPHRPIGSALLLALTLCAAGPAAAQTYTFTDLGTLPGGGASQALALSPLGVAVGSANLANGGSHAVQFGSPNKDLGALAGGLSSAQGVNAQGTAVGLSYVSTSSSAFHAVVFKAGKISDLGLLSGFFSQAVGINSNGLVVGNADLYGGANRGWTYQIGVSKALQPLPTLGGFNSAAAAVNDAGVVVGSANVAGPYAAGGAQHAAMWNQGVVTDLGTLVPANVDANSAATAISSNGLIAGSSMAADGVVHAFLYANGHMNDLGLLAGTNMTAATGVNAAGVVVGTANIPRLDYRGRPQPGKGTLVTFVYRNGTMTNLTALLPAGWVMRRVAAINDAGQIAGTASAPDGMQHAVLLSP